MLAVLHSSFTWLFLRETYGTLGIDGGINFSPSNVREIPVPAMTADNEKDLALMVDEIVDAIKRNIDLDIAPQQAAIDEYLARLLGVGASDVREAIG